MLSLQPQPLRIGVGEILDRVEVLGKGGAQAESPFEKMAEREKKFNEVQEARISLQAPSFAVHRVSMMDGIKTVVVVSPGFSASELTKQYDDLVQLALRNAVVVNALDPQGLVPNAGAFPGCAFSQDCTVDGSTVHGPNRSAKGLDDLAKISFIRHLVYDSGGKLFRNNNDLDTGFRRVNSLPEHAYILGFTPRPLKEDDQFHKLRVIVRRSGRFHVQARRGYYAVKKARPHAQEAKEAIEDELRSRDEVHAFPMRFKTQFYRTASAEVHLTGADSH